MRHPVWPDAVHLGPGLVGPELVGRQLFPGQTSVAPRRRLRTLRRRRRPTTSPLT